MSQEQPATERPVTVVALPQDLPSPVTPAVAPPAMDSPRVRLRRPDSVGHWPVPHVMVYYREIKIAWGRDAIAQMTKQASRTKICLRVAFDNSHYEGSSFARNAVLFGTFYHTTGKDDWGPVMLGSLGWSEMIQNVVRIELVYHEG
ncbi:hypothetical protein DICSQDRAFT_166604 [Dichomitus squalens LYAD-421 SS1]|uniref:Uncharacterized protein n=1 Tax=Dichomitus squalens TaxID=114155 RepID=A0A4Q9PJP6_9APHY|nr:uncharacterized protein DICSQDRAFT_166604 [Dichomitus squalens LYAD-421 SS1]EJF65601.1 hypothetical protein DICSQDRAFT_166604 [Dichomitus squalens LYAD-421 SS1]TBU54327.1 hypothetical protein BD310DRAFT_828238 [Dichomitus squalens]